MRKILLAVVVGLFISASLWSDSATDEKAVWSLEEAYWQYVKSNDVKDYVTLWDDNFIGWPGFSQEPVGSEYQ